MRNPFCLSLAFFALTLAQAQVSNNNIQNRTELGLDAGWTHSSTANATVEWACINKALTNKCLVYHNDQWFYFRTDKAGKYYLNIATQKCRDSRGVQLIVIEGNPCEIKTYKIIQCIPQIRQDDVFLELDSIKANTQYLVNVDGFLADACEFDIGFSQKPNGFPRTLVSLDTLNLKTFLNDSSVFIQWTINTTLAPAIDFFKVYRIKKGEVKSVLVNEQRIQANAFGAFITAYSMEDILTQQGSYTYRIMGLLKETSYPLLLDEQTISFVPVKKIKPLEKPKHIIVPVHFDQNSNFEILVFDQLNNRLLIKFTPGKIEIKNKAVEIILDGFADAGVKEFMILCSDFRSGQSREYYYKIDTKGNIIAE